MNGRCLIFLGGTVYSTPPSATVEKKMRRLAEQGEITVVGWADGLWPRHLRQPVRFVLLPRLPIIALRYPLFLVAGVWVALRAMRRYASNVLVAQSPYEGVVALLGRALARLRGIRAVLIVEVHGDWEVVPQLFRRLWFPRLSASVMAKTARMALRAADIVRVISRFTEEKVRQICPRTPIVRFPTFTDLEVFLRGNARCGKAADFPYILYVGMLVPSKGVEILIRAFDRAVRAHPGVHLVLIGSGHAEDQYRSLVQALELARSVRFVPFMAQVDLAAWMRGAVCLVLPSFSEGWGRVVLEAMACGRPVIGTSVGGIPEMIEDGVNGYLVAPGDPEALAARILDVLGDPNRAEEMGKRGRAIADTLFSEDGYFRAFEGMVGLAVSLAAGGRGRTGGSVESPDGRGLG